MEIRTVSISYAKSKAKSTYHREQEIKQQLDHLVNIICNNLFSTHINQVLQEYDNLKTELRSIYEDKGSKLCLGQSVTGWRMENVPPNISLIWKNETITKKL